MLSENHSAEIFSCRNFFCRNFFCRNWKQLSEFFCAEVFPPNFFPRKVLVNNVFNNNSPLFKVFNFYQTPILYRPPPYNSIRARYRGHRIYYSKFIYDSLTLLLTFFSNLIFGPEMALKVVFGIFSGINFRGVLFSRIFKNPNFRGVLFSRFCPIRENKIRRKLIPAKINPREN